MSEALTDLLDATLAYHLEGTHTAMPATVVSVKGNRINAQPALSRKLRDGTVEKLPVIPNVPVWFPRGGGASITWPIAVGDGCLLIFSERSLDEWKDAGAASTPEDPRKHGLSDAIAFVGLDANAGGSDAIELKMGGTTLAVSEGGVAITGGTVTHNGTDIGDSHKHSDVSRGTSETGEPV